MFTALDTLLDTIGGLLVASAAGYDVASNASQYGTVGMSFWENVVMPWFVGLGIVLDNIGDLLAAL